jgi:hypothetical protein
LKITGRIKNKCKDLLDSEVGDNITKKIRHYPSEIDRVLVHESAYIAGGYSLLDLPDEIAQTIGDAIIKSGIEMEAKCPDCKIDMDIWNVPYNKSTPYIRNGNVIIATHHDIFCCPNCGYIRDRKICD